MISKDTATFHRRLEQSKGGVWLVAKWLNDKWKYNTLITSNEVCDDLKNRINYVDNGDLYISKHIQGQKINPNLASYLRVEVKSSSKDYTSKEDYPFENVRVCAKNSYDHSDPKPYMYVILNRNKTHAVIIVCETHEHWIVKQQRDNAYDEDKAKIQDVYDCPIQYVHFVEL